MNAAASETLVSDKQNVLMNKCQIQCKSTVHTQVQAQLIVHMHKVQVPKRLPCTCGDKCAVSTFTSSKDMPKLYLANCKISCTVAASCKLAVSTSTCCCSCSLPVTAKMLLWT